VVRLDDATLATFEPHVATDFGLDPGSGAPIAVRLTEVRPLGLQPGAPRVEPFVLVFSGPAEPIMTQATYTLAHDDLGPMELFLVPIGRDADGNVQYEAVFN
jgi:hypothetical protein